MGSTTKYRPSARVRIARMLDSVLPILGVAAVLAAVVIGGGGRGPIWLAVIGLLMVEAGVWRLGSRMMNERRYLPLRTEVQRFIGLARELNRRSADAGPAIGAAEDPALEETIAALRDSLDRMVGVAGKTAAEVKAEREAPEAPEAPRPRVEA